MREIKFRAWDKEQHVIIDEKEPWNTKQGKMKYDYETIFYALAGNEKDRYVIQQYTGLNDKNGTEIYEGDILKASLSFVYIVEFLDGCYWIRDIKDNGRNYMHQTRMKLFEIIGNIYDK